MIVLTMRQADRDAICQRCTKPDCIGQESRDCPVQVEQRRRWRERYRQQKRQEVSPRC
jgi:hypothetical protein